MVRFLAILHKRADVSPEEFVRYWKEVHAPIVMKMPGIRRFRENIVRSCRVPGIEPFAIGELWFDSEEAGLAALKSEEGKKALASGGNIINQERNAGIAVEEIADFRE